MENNRQTLLQTLLLLGLLTAWGCATTPPKEELKEEKKVSFYFAAHPDDWQLFIGEKAWSDLRDPSHQVIFIMSTAGDAAMGITASEEANMPYYKARERGYINSVIWSADGNIQVDTANRSTLPLQEYTLEKTTINGHEVKKFSYKNATAYLFYLPDGFGQGQHTWSLQKLKNGEIDDIPTVDSATIYQNWSDLKATVQTVLKDNINEATEVTFNLAERDTTLNPGDHSDHKHTSMLAEEASDGLGGTLRYFREYHTSKLDTNLTADDIKIKQFLFSACALSKEQGGYETPWEPIHLAWTYRSYYKEEPNH